MEQPRGGGLVKLAASSVIIFDVVVLLVVAGECLPGTCPQFWGFVLALALANIVVFAVFAAIDAWARRDGGLGSLPPRGANEFRPLVVAVVVFFVVTGIWALKSYLCTACFLVGDVVAFIASYVAAAYIIRRLTGQRKS